MTQVSGIQEQDTVMRCLPTDGGKLRKEVQFNVDKELGDELSLPSDLTLFLAEGMVPK